MGRSAFIHLLLGCLYLSALGPEPALAESAIPGASERLVKACTHTEIHSGECVAPYTGRIATLVDAVAISGDRCRESVGGGGDDSVLCRYNGTDWREVGAKPTVTSSAMAAGAGLLVLDILNPPPGSGLTPPVADGIDGQPTAPRTNAAPEINAAIQYACDNGYDVAYLGPGTYRIGEANTIASFYTGVRLDAERCPNGIKFYGAGPGRTLLLANGEGGQYIIFTTDEYQNPTKVHRIGWGVFGGIGPTAAPYVSNITTGVTPPVVTGTEEGRLEDGDTVYARNCSGSVEINERTFKVNNCTQVAPYTCELQDEFGVDIDATNWAPWSPVTECVLGKLNPDFTVEIAYMTLRDDDPSAHSHEVCNPTCQQAQEESHGIGVLQGGGIVEIHHLVIDTVGDEAIDISAPESPTYVHDVAILNPEVSGPSIYQGVGIRIEDVSVHKGTPSTQYLGTFSAGNALVVDPGRKNWRVVDLKVNRMVATGRLRLGFSILTNSTGFNGQYVSGIEVTNSVIDIEPDPARCSGGQMCGSFWVRSKEETFPIENIDVSGNLLGGTAYLNVSEGAGGVVLSNNTIVPIPNIDPKWAVRVESIHTNIRDNHISNFQRGCILYEPYPTNGGANGTITLEIKSNVLECDSNDADRDAMIGPLSIQGVDPASNDEGYFRVLDNQITAGAADFIRYGANITRPFKGVEVCRNTISLDPAISVGSSIGVWSQAPDQIVCNNTISLAGGGVRVDADGSKIVGNTINGFDTTQSNGIYVFESSDTLISKNIVNDYQDPSSSGIKIDAGSAAQTKVWIIGNSVGEANVGIELDGSGVGIDEANIAGNNIDLNGYGPAQAVRLTDTTDARVIANDLTGLEGSGVDALLTTGNTDFIVVRDNLAEGGGTLKFGTTGGDASCDPVGGVGANSTCSNNTVQ